MGEQLISESITPITGQVDERRITIGAPLLPTRFIWRGVEYSVAEVLESWKETSPCRHGSGERYVRKHWFRVRTAGNEEMKIYFERQPRSGRQRKQRWWLYTLREGVTGKLPKIT